MPGAGRAEFYFITAMMILIVVVSGVSVYYFFKTYKKEMREKAERDAERAGRRDAETGKLRMVNCEEEVSELKTEN